MSSLHMLGGEAFAKQHQIALCDCVNLQWCRLDEKLKEMK